MEQSNSLISRSVPLERLVTEAQREIERLGYSRRSRNRYRAIWERLIEFSNRKKLGHEFSGDLAACFLACISTDNYSPKRQADLRVHCKWSNVTTAHSTRALQFAAQ